LTLRITRGHGPGKNFWTTPVGLLFLFSTLLSQSRGQSIPANNADTLIPGGTAIKLRLTQTITSTHAHKGDPLNFEVVKDVTVNGLTVIRAGSIAQGTVAKVHGRRLCGVGGQLVIKLDSVELATGERVKLDGQREFKGHSHTKLMAEGMVLAGLIYLPAAPALLITHGHECTALKGSEVTAHIEGDWQVHSAGLSGSPETTPSLSEIISMLPPRVLNGQGREGDMMNLIFVAREDEFRRAFASAGWVEPDKMRGTLFWHLIWQRRHYARLPMDTFYAFGRRQDMSYSLPDPTCILTRRHHVRIWKTDYEVNGVPVWVGAATHDVALEFAMHGLWMTHRIDPDVDAEREFIAQDLMKTDLVTREEYLPSAVPIFEARTTTGEPFHTDSRVLMLELSQAPAPTFARIQPPARVPRWLHRSAYKESLPVATPFK
jgi:hypothetical protein